MSDMFDKLAESRKLPLGHYGRRDAQDRVDREYAACREISVKWCKKLKRKAWVLTADQVRTLYRELGECIGQRPLRRVTFRSTEVHSMAAAHYKSREIHFRGDSASFATAVHEYTHYAAGSHHGHGPVFCEILDFLFPIALGIWKDMC